MTAIDRAMQARATDRNYIREAARIAGGKTLLLPQREHLEAQAVQLAACRDTFTRLSEWAAEGYALLHQPDRDEWAEVHLGAALVKLQTVAEQASRQLAELLAVEES